MAGKNPPVKKFRAGNIQVAIFENQGEDKTTKKKFSFFTIQVQRSYTKDVEGKQTWINEILNCRKQDLGKLLVAVNKANEFVFLTGKDEPEEVKAEE